MNRRSFDINQIVGVPDYSVTEFKTKYHKVALVIPILNEKPRILEQLKRIQILGPDVDVIVVDGGSTDEIEKDLQITEYGLSAFLIKNGNGSLSAQLRVGFHFCVERGYEFVITMDGNGKDGAEGINTIKDRLEMDFDFVQGSRFIKGGRSENTPISRYLAIRFIHAPLTSLGSRYWFTDSTNGFRGHSLSLLTHPEVQIFRDEFDSYELLAYLPIMARKVGLTVCEAPVIRRYPVGVATPTKIHGLSSQLRILLILLKSIIGEYRPKQL